MQDQNGKDTENMQNHPSKIFEKPFKEIPFYIIKEKMKKNELIIEDILSSNECIEDLKTNSKSKFKKMITTENIKKLISFCIYPSESNSIISYDTLRYPYYSSELLCSPSILQFSKSAESILKANERQNKMNEKKLNKGEENDINYVLLLNENNENNIQEDIFSQEEQKQEERIENNYDDFFFESKGLDHEEFMNFDKHQETESEIQTTTMVNNTKTHFEEKENELIKEIMEKIFDFLKQKINLDETCVGYFQKMVNYLLINEPKVTTDYLFNDNYLIIRNFYNHMNNASMENILENILNYISDQEIKEDNLENSKFNLIILELLDEIGCNINKEYNDNNDYINYINDKNKIEFITELIINTLINNTEQHLIKLVFNPNCIFMNKLIFLIKKSANLEYNNEKNNKKNLIINLLEIAQQINIIIMNSKNLTLKNNSKDDVIFFSDFYKKIKTFENQYFCKKIINRDNIYESFVAKRELYINSIKKIYEIIKNDIIKNTDLNNDNKKEKEKGITLMFLSEWKFILSGLKIFIFQFYAIEEFKPNNNKDFYDENLFDLSIQLFFISGKNNLYQNIFIDIIKLLNFELVPKYFINYFSKKQKLFIEKIIDKKDKDDKDDKYNLLLGPCIQILLLFYSSRNPYLYQFYNNEKNRNEKELKDEFIYLIKPKFERKFDENYEYIEDEIFTDANDSIDTFDGNDSSNNSKIIFKPFKTIVNNFFKKINLNNNNNSNNKMSDQNQIQNQGSNPNQNIRISPITPNMEIEESKTVGPINQPGIYPPGIKSNTKLKLIK